MKEEWKDIKDYEGYYQVSNLGRVRSLDREVEVHLSNGTTYFRTKKGKILKLGNNTNTGYLSVSFSVNGHHKTRDVHRLVAETFLPKENGKNYESVTAAAKDTGCDRRAITLVLSGQNKTCKGYTFKYIPK